MQVSYTFRNVKENQFLPQKFPLIREPGKQHTLLCLHCPLWTAASSLDFEQQNPLTTQHLFPRPNISSQTRKINSKVYIYQYHLAKFATTAHFGVGKRIILMDAKHFLSVLMQSNDNGK